MPRLDGRAPALVVYRYFHFEFRGWVSPGLQHTRHRSIYREPGAVSGVSDRKGTKLATTETAPRSTRAQSQAQRAIAAAREFLFSWPGLALLFGLALRLSRYLANQTLYNDEATLVINILRRSFTGLATPLDRDQAAPVGFLFSVKLTSVVFGVSEYALRIVPLVAGLASVVLFYLLAKRLLAKAPAVFATILFAACWMPANYSHFVKQYSSDVAVTTGILLAAVTLRPEEARRPAALGGLAATGSLAVLFSHAAVFVLAGAGMAWIVRDWRREGRLDWRLHVAVPAVWAGTFAAHYALLLRHTAGNAYLLYFWQDQDAFMPFPPTSISDLLWYPTAFRDIFASIDGTPAGLYMAMASCALAAIGCWFYFRRNPFVFTMLIAPVVFTLAASALKKYPFSHRLVLFLYPIFILLLAAGLGAILARFRARPYLAAVLAVAILGPPVAKAAYGLWRQPGTQEVKPLLRVIGEQYQPGDLVWVDTSAQSIFEYYRDYAGWFPGFAFRNVCDHSCHSEGDAAKLDSAVRKAAGNRRVWVVMAFVEAESQEKEGQILARLDTLGSRIERVAGNGAALTLFAMRR